MSANELLARLREGDFKALSRILSIVENQPEDAHELLCSLNLDKQVPVIGITGPPGAGKSTLLDALLEGLLRQNKKVAVMVVDPSSPFTGGALLGDRIRMGRHFDHPNVFIRSFASRGSLGGLPAMGHELCDVLREAGFDFIFIETVGVGQAEVDVATIADSVVVVLTPESGDDVQSMKAGLLEIADVFVVNKGDHPGADVFVKHLEALASKRALRQHDIPVVKTTATTGEGVEQLIGLLAGAAKHDDERRMNLLTDKLFRIIQQRRMHGVDGSELRKSIQEALANGQVNLYRLAEKLS